VQDGYFNNSELLTQANEFTLDETLVEALDKTGRTPKSRDVKVMYYNKRSYETGSVVLFVS